MTDDATESFRRPLAPDDADHTVEPDDDYHDQALKDVRWLLTRGGKTRLWGAGNLHVDLPPDEGWTLHYANIDFDYQIRPAHAYILRADPLDPDVETTLGFATGTSFQYSNQKDAESKRTQLEGEGELVEAAWALSRFYPFVQHSGGAE